MSNSRVPNKEVERTGRVGDVMYSGVMWSVPTSNMEGSEPSPDCGIGTKLEILGPMPGGKVAYSMVGR